MMGAEKTRFPEAAQNAPLGGFCGLALEQGAD